LTEVVAEFMKRATTIENEIALLQEDLHELKEEFSEKLDTKTLSAAMRVIKIRNKVDKKDAFDAFCNILTELNV